MNIRFALVIGAAVAAVGLGIAGAAAGTATPVGADMRLVAAGTSADVGSKVRDKIVDIGSNEVGKKRSVETGGQLQLLQPGSQPGVPRVVRGLRQVDLGEGGGGHLRVVRRRGQLRHVRAQARQLAPGPQPQGGQAR